MSVSRRGRLVSFHHVDALDLVDLPFEFKTAKNDSTFLTFSRLYNACAWKMRDWKDENLYTGIKSYFSETKQ